MFWNKRNISKTAVEGTAAIHTMSGTIQSQHLLSRCQIQYSACEKMLLSLYAYVITGNSMGIQTAFIVFVTVLSTTEAWFSHDFWKLSWLAHSLSLATAATDPLHGRCPFFSVPRVNGVFSVSHTYAMFAPQQKLYFCTETSIIWLSQRLLRCLYEKVLF